MFSSVKNSAQLINSRKTYEILAQKIAQSFADGDYEKTLGMISVAANFVWQNHVGFFSDGKLENVALHIGEKLDALPSDETIFDAFDQKRQKTSRKKVLHVASRVHITGGHTRLLKNWIKAFPEFEHSLVLTDQKLLPIPESLPEIIGKNHGQLFNLSSNSLLGKAKTLRHIARSGFECVFLHHNPNDVILVVALAVADCPPVAVVNHADHVFWLGSSVTDLVIDFCRLGEKLSLERRFAKRTTIVPFLIDTPQPQISRAAARDWLGIEKEETVLITIGHSYKFDPTKKHNFFSTAAKILDRNPQAKLFLIGPDKKQAAANYHDRMIFTGEVPDTAPYQVAADIYLDGFPIGGGMAAVESVLLDVCPVFAYSQPLDSTARKLIEFEDSVAVYNSEADYVDAVGDLIKNPKNRAEIVAELKKNIEFLHGKEKLAEYKNATFGKLDELCHKPQMLPFSENLTQNEDVFLIKFNESKKSEYPAILSSLWESDSRTFTASDYLSLFALSVRQRDTKFSYTHLRAWMGTMLARKNDKPAT